MRGGCQSSEQPRREYACVGPAHRRRRLHVYIAILVRPVVGVRHKLQETHPWPRVVAHCYQDAIAVLPYIVVC